MASVSFTEHADFTPWVVPSDAESSRGQSSDEQEPFQPPPLKLDEYRACLERCRDRYPQLRIRFGVELSEPHWHDAPVRTLLDRGSFELVLASVHSAKTGAGSAFTDVGMAYGRQPPHQVVREYLLETARMVEEFTDFEVLAHIDYPIRYWPLDTPHDPLDFEDEYRHILRGLSAAEKTLEVNTRVPLHPLVLMWWRQEGGRTITFASDAHEPDRLAHGFVDARELAIAAGFGCGLDPFDVWRVD